MRIYRVIIEHKKFGRNFASNHVCAKTLQEALKQAMKGRTKQEIPESAEILAEAD